MECAGRALAFWSYQSTQEMYVCNTTFACAALTISSVYQEYLAKTLTDKYSTLNVQMDKVINDANSELNILNQKLNSMCPETCRCPIIDLQQDLQIDADRLKTENTSLVAAYREKARKHQQTQELYDRLKRKEMATAVQSAAFESVDEVLGITPSRPEYGSTLYPEQYSAQQRKQTQRDMFPIHADHNGIEQVHSHQRSGSNNSQGSGGLMPPPPIRPPAGVSNPFSHGEFCSC